MEPNERHSPIFRAVVFAALLLLLAAASSAWGIQAGSGQDKPGQEASGLYRESHALVIGVSFYSGGWPPLPGVRSDVEAVSAALKRQGFSVTVVENPDQEKLEEAFKDFILTYGLNPENRLLVYFAGHGYTHKPAYASDDPQEWTGYIVSREAPRPSRDLPGFFRNAMSLERISNFALQIEAKHALFLFDSCFAGTVFSQSRGFPPDIEERTARPVRQFITSGSADQEVPDQSIFRRQFIEALEGEADLNKDGFLTGSELGMFLQEKVTNYSRRSQTPQYGKIRHHRLDKGDFVFFLSEASTPAKAPQAEEARKPRGKVVPGASKEPGAVGKDERRREAARRLMAGRQEIFQERAFAEPQVFAYRYEPETPEVKPPPKPAGASWAVVVGVGSYKDPDILGLEYAERNARAVARFFESPSGGAFKGVKLLLNEQATRAGLKEALEGYFRQAGSDDLVVVYLAGAGLKEPGVIGKPYFAPYDAKIADLESTALPLKELTGILQERVASRRVVLITEALRLRVPDSLMGSAALLASDDTEAPKEGARWGEGGGGAFTHYLLEGLEGAADGDRDGLVTLGEAFRYTYQQVVDATHDAQHPKLKGMFGETIPLTVVK